MSNIRAGSFWLDQEQREKLQELRVLEGMVQRELAQKVGVSREAINGIENGKRRITLEELETILQICCTDLEAFFDGPIPRSIQAEIDESNAMAAANTRPKEEVESEKCIVERSPAEESRPSPRRRQAKISRLDPIPSGKVLPPISETMWNLFEIIRTFNQWELERMIEEARFIREFDEGGE